MELVPCPNCSFECPLPANNFNLIFPACILLPPQTCSICGGLYHQSQFHDYYMRKVNEHNQLQAMRGKVDSCGDSSGGGVDGGGGDPFVDTSMHQQQTPNTEANEQEKTEALLQADRFLATLGDDFLATSGECDDSEDMSANPAPDMVLPIRTFGTGTGADTPKLDDQIQRAIAEGRRIQISNLYANITETDLSKLLRNSEVGSTIRVPTPEGCAVFASYASAQQAESAIAYLRGNSYDAQIVSKNHTKNMKATGSSPEDHKLFIDNLGPATTEGDLTAFFKGYKTKTIVLTRDIGLGTGVLLGHAVITMHSASDAENAVAELAGKSLLGNIVSLRRSVLRKASTVPNQPLSQRAAVLKEKLEKAQRERRDSTNAAKPLTVALAPRDRRETPTFARPATPSSMAVTSRHGTSSVNPLSQASAAVTTRPRTGSVMSRTGLFRPPPSAPQDIRRQGVSADKPLKPTLARPRCAICPGQHMTFASECAFKQDHYAVAVMLDSKLGGIYNGPKLFHNYTELLQYDIHDRPGGPVIRWPAPKKLAREMSDEQFSLILLDVLSYKLPSEPPQDMTPMVSNQMVAPAAAPPTIGNHASVQDPYPTSCPICMGTRIFGDHRTLGEHLRFRHQLRPRAVSIALNQVRSTRTATGVIRCLLCNDERVFVDEVALRQHTVAAHPSVHAGSGASITLPTGKFACSLCHREAAPFVLASALTQHIAAVHPEALNQAVLPSTLQPTLPPTLHPTSAGMKRGRDDSRDSGDRKRHRPGTDLYRPMIKREKLDEAAKDHHIPTTMIKREKEDDAAKPQAPIRNWSTETTIGASRGRPVTRPRSPAARTRSPREDQRNRLTRSRSPVRGRESLPAVNSVARANRLRSPLTLSDAVARRGGELSQDDEAARQQWRRQRDSSELLRSSRESSRPVSPETRRDWQLGDSYRPAPSGRRSGDFYDGPARPAALGNLSHYSPSPSPTPARYVPRMPRAMLVPTGPRGLAGPAASGSERLGMYDDGYWNKPDVMSRGTSREVGRLSRDWEEEEAEVEGGKGRDA